MRGLKHKNLVPLLDYFQDKQAEILKSPLKVGLSSKFTRVLNFENFLQAVYLVQDLVPGGDLYDR
jgi:hypothetical protein